MKIENEKKNFQIIEENKNIQRENSMIEKIQTPIKKHTPIISFHGKKKRRRFSLRPLILPTICIIIATTMLSSFIEKSLKDKILILAEAAAEKHLLETVNYEVTKMAEDGLFSYGSMVKTIRDDSGQVIYLEVDTGMLAKAKADLISRIDTSLEENKRITIKIPFGSLAGWNLFSSLGIPISVRVFPIGMTEGEIYTVLEDCGINQTRHLIQVKIEARLLIVLPEETTQVETEVCLPLGERVLVGDVPEIYLDNIGGN
ncbi:MAG: sporulation protein YunB [Clostridia bacterium]|nr:sporulation protein YunB [Clostridia bacterium]